MSDSSSLSSSLSSSDVLKFILQESSDDALMLEYLLHDENDIKKIELVMKLRQVRQEKGASSS